MEDAVAYALSVIRPVLQLAPTTFLAETARWLDEWCVRKAVAEHDTATIFDWIVPLLALQGIGDHAATHFAGRHAPVTWRLIDEAMRAAPSCQRLTSYWRFHACRYRKAVRSCAEPAHMPACFLPTLPLRKGALNQAVVGLHLFVCDVCGGDFVGWIDARLAAADPGPHAADRGRALAGALIEPLSNIVGTGPKVWSMILSDLLLAADPDRKRWVAAGAAMTAIDSLVHSFLVRTGILARFDAEHSYGNACFEPGGCVGVIDAIATNIDARNFDPAFPTCFPRFVEKAVWHFCAEGGRGICNGRRIDDRARCGQIFCPCFPSCDRRPLRSIIRLC